MGKLRNLKQEKTHKSLDDPHFEAAKKIVASLEQHLTDAKVSFIKYSILSNYFARQVKVLN